MIKKITSNYSLFVEKINLSVNELERITSLTLKEKIRYNKFNNEKRKTEWLGTRYLLQKYYTKTTIIEYNKHGKPQLNTGEQISISHSLGIVGILISKKENIGLDIEHKQKKIDRIKQKFLNVQELEFIEKTENKTELLTIFWSAKETLLKIYGKTNLIFNEQLFIEYNNNKITGKIITNNYNLTINLKKIIIDNIIIIFAIS